MARTMLCDKNLPKYFWAEAVNSACHILNRVSIRPILKKTPYELYKGRKPNISHFHVFSSVCYILNNGTESLGKFDAKSDEGIFLGYSSQSKGYRVFNKRTLVVEETIQVIVDDISVDIPKSKEDCENEATQNLEKLTLNQNESNSPNIDSFEEVQIPQEKEPTFPRERKYVKENEIIGDPSKGIRTRLSIRNECQFAIFLSQIEPENIKEALSDENWIIAMQEELNQFERSEVWKLVPRPKDYPTIGKKMGL